MKYFNTDFTLNNCLFGSVKLTKETDLDKYKYTGYETGFDSRGYSLSDGSVDKNAIIFRVDMSSSVHIDNKGKNILILREGKKRRLDGSTCTAEAKYPINFTQSKKRFVSRPHHNGNKIFCLLMLQKYINSKQKSQK